MAPDWVAVGGKPLPARGRRRRKRRGVRLVLSVGVAAGSLRVDLGPYPAALYGHEAVARLVGRHVGISCEMRISHWRAAVAAVLDRTSHAAVAELSVVANDLRLETEALASRPGVFVCRADHELLRGGAPTVEDLMRWPWVSTELPARVAQLLPADVGRAGRRELPTGSFLPIDGSWVNE